jgi:hypothetical protein
MFQKQICAHFLLALVVTTGLLAQSAKKPLTNTDVLDMVHAGLADSTIVLAIKNSETNFDTSPQALIALKKSGVTQSVMDAMLGAGRIAPSPVPVSTNSADGRALMAKVVNAMGGEKTINAVKSIRIQSTREVKTPALSTTLDLIVTAVYPDRVHVAIKAPQVNNVTVYQPNGAFVLVGGKPQPFPEAAQQETLNLIKMSSIYLAQHVNDPKYSFTISGSEKIGQVDTAVLEISVEGKQTRWNVDPVSGKIIRVTRLMARASGAPALTRFEYDDWRTVSGVTVPFKVFQNGVSNGEIKSYEINPEIPAGLFDKPSGVSSPAAAPSAVAASPTASHSNAAPDGGTRSAWKAPLFRDVRQKYENTTVLVLANPSSMRILGHLTEWQLAKEKKGRYVGTEKYLDFKYVGQTAKVIGVQLEHNSIEEAHRLGPSEDDTLDPYFSLVVRFDDGTTAMATTFPIGAKDIAVPADDAARHLAAMQAGATAMVGKKVYAIAYSHFYYPDLKVADAVEVVQTGYASTSVDQVRDVPHLQPLTVTKVGFLKPANALLLTLVLPDGRNVISMVKCDGKDDSCFGNYGSELFAEIPSALTTEEVEAIRRGTYFTGMSKGALYMSIGLPDRENDYGRGGYQLVYANGKVLIYTDADGKIADSQSFD